MSLFDAELRSRLRELARQSAQCTAIATNPTVHNQYCPVHEGINVHGPRRELALACSPDRILTLLARLEALEKIADAARDVIVGHVIDVYPSEVDWTKEEDALGVALAALTRSETP